MVTLKKLIGRSRSTQSRRNRRRAGRLESLEDRRMFSVDLNAVPAAVSAALANGVADNGGGVPANLAAVAEQLTHSPEYYSDFVTWAYQQFMGRTPDPSGLAYWLGQLQSGTTDEQLESNFLAAPEYIADHGGSDVNWVVGMYNDLLGRSPDSAGLAYWTSQIEAGESEFSIALGFATSAEREGIVVSQDYQTYLGRSPSQEEIGFWVGQFENNDQRNEDVIAGFIGSAEYYNDPNQGAGNATTWLDSVFKELYQRSPTEAELDSWLGQLGEDVPTPTAPTAPATPTAPTVPTAPTFTAAATSATQVNLSWESVSGASGYFVDELVNGAWQQIEQVDSGTSSVTLNDLSPSTNYSFEIGAYNSAGMVWSNPISVTTLEDVPAAPSVTVSEVSATQATLSWNSVSGAAGYLVDQLVDGAAQQIGEHDSGTTSDTLTGMTRGTSYTFEVGAYNSAGTVWSNPISVTTNAALTAPSVTVSNITTTQATLSWNSVSGAAGYFVDELANGTLLQIGQYDSGTTSQTLTQMTPGTTYQFEVGAYNSAGTVWSNPISVTTNAALTAPSVTVSNITTTQATLSWNSVSGAAGYFVDQLTNGTLQQIGQYDSGTTSQTVNQLSPGTTYQFEVGAYNSAGTVWSDPISVTTNAADWFSQNLPDTAIQDMARNDVQQHQSITRNDMLQIFAEVEQQGAVTASELTSLQNLVNNSLLLHMPDYVFDLADKVVSSDPANRFCATSSNPSGNLYAGAPAADLALLVGDWFLGEGSISAPGTASYGPANGTLFGPAGPEYTDVYQGTLGDCTLMASMAEVAARQPDLIRDMFVDNGDGTYTVRLFVNGAQDYVTVNDDLPDDGQEYARVVGGVLWPALLEKAIVEENESGMLATMSPGSNSYSAINDGDAETTIAYLVAITGWSSGQFAVNPGNIATAWNDGDLVVLGTGNTPDPLYIEHNHAYAMVGYNSSSNTPFLLFNPWGIAGGKDTSGQFYYGEVSVNGAALDDYFAFAADASSAVASGPQALSSSTAGSTTSAVGPEAPDASETAAPVSSVHDAVFAETSWMDGMGD